MTATAHHHPPDALPESHHQPASTSKTSPVATITTSNNHHIQQLRRRASIILVVKGTSSSPSNIYTDLFVCFPCPVTQTTTGDERPSPTPAPTNIIPSNRPCPLCRSLISLSPTDANCMQKLIPDVVMLH
ncbi:uncharacterized protein LACBIDRAFT_299546 [Laccaria bicolor S238N-H82]|uniref:Predicted protein n=1 Tax=Laccaria bicolor (strain S238N-H82 / ATCC MYA-4686) TaxID=486041 RepID=B0CQC6_LACBS|nr:uncharacterized protein LACBIDRAFT_302007 [Laccaria bicolor S238N-H82]XP_001890840.1 uncharacterized protein LACBIDRAFT_299546 [Laccaria bicolor S238N-H82]EDQ98510.1 predicted protein [Laccaria bicolor S238N-H82]EDR16182.1 predicted protein [Laccaria bicolor S238N-H82]|eukprot:XP_001874390.1 predicted protein [Laccaria bicolor S238N-H82]